MNASDSKVSQTDAARVPTGLALALVWGYFSAIFLAGEYLGPLRFGLWTWIISIPIVALAGRRILDRAIAQARLRATDVSNYALLSIVTVIGLVALDTGYGIYLNSTRVDKDPARSRVFDENVWVSELYPKVYYPTERNFALHKPGVSVAGTPYGNFYSDSMKRSPTLTEAVLERNPISIRINELGFRESTALGEARIFTLGDSFTFGWGLNDHESWPGLLEAQTGRRVYNLGIHDASPKQELELLRHLLERNDKVVNIDTLLWMFYEGNDLEDDFSETVTRPDAAKPVPPLRGTLVEALERLMWTVKKQSVIHKLLNGQLTWKSPTADTAKNPYTVDGIDLLYPLYHSDTLGSRLFYQTYIDLAGEEKSYVDGHWNRDALEQVFTDMRALAVEHDFDVVVILAPSAARLHGPYFRDFPPLSAEPHFLEFLTELSERAEFRTIDLYQLMQPMAGVELLYFRDDDHFNQRGSEVAAELIRNTLFPDARDQTAP